MTQVVPHARSTFGDVSQTKLDSLAPNGWNPNVMTATGFDSLKHGLKTDGWCSSQALLVWGKDERGKTRNVIVDGEHRWRAALDEGFTHGPAVVIDGWTEKEAKTWTIKLNAKRGEFEDEPLAALVTDLVESDNLDFAALDLGLDLDHLTRLFEDREELQATPGGGLLKAFLMSPFTILDSRRGAWRERRKFWNGLGLQSQLGRDEQLIHGGGERAWNAKSVRRDKEGKLVYLGEGTGWNGTSIFDPVLAELAVSWFCPVGGSVLDPFAGGSVRGVVTSVLKRRYTGLDVRQEQIEENQKQWSGMKLDGPEPSWLLGAAQDAGHVLGTERFDLVFSCPPYGDLERYSDLPEDLSTLSWTDFSKVYHAGVSDACKRLKENRFAVFVVGNYRDRKTGRLHDLAALTVQAAEHGGAGFWNDGIVVRPSPSVALRAGRIFRLTRKFGRLHESFLVFFNGKQKSIPSELGEVEILEVDDNGDELWTDPAEPEDLEPETGDDKTVLVELTGKTARQLFNGCESDFIRDVCQGKCCRAPSSPAGIIVTIHHSEEEAIRARGGEIQDGLLVPKDRRCPFQDEGTNLCVLHGDGKPTGCAVSPWAFSPTGRKLIVRNRYRRLPCYGKGLPAYRAFRGSLESLVGSEETERAVSELDSGAKSVRLRVPTQLVALITEKSAKSSKEAKTQ